MCVTAGPPGAPRAFESESLPGVSAAARVGVATDRSSPAVPTPHGVFHPSTDGGVETTKSARRLRTVEAIDVYGVYPSDVHLICRALSSRSGNCELDCHAALAGGMGTRPASKRIDLQRFTFSS